MVAPPVVETKTATNMTASLPITSYPRTLSKNPTSLATPNMKQEEAMPVLLKRDVHPSTNLMALSEEKEKESEQAAAPPKERKDAVKNPMHLHRQLRRGFKISTF